MSSRLNQHRSAPGSRPRNDVGDPVSHHETGPQVQLAFLRGPQEQTGSRLPAIAHHPVTGQRCLGVMRTKVKTIQRRSAGAQQEFFKASLDITDFLFGGLPAGDDGLIGDDNEFKTAPTQRGQRLGHTFQDSQVIGACEKVNIFDHHPVAVQENGASHGVVTDSAAELKGRAR